MNITKIKSTNLSKRKQLKLKQYELNFERFSFDELNFSLYERMDLNDLRNAAISEMEICNNIPLTQISKHNFTELLQNQNIKKIKLFIYTSSNKWLIFISKLLLKNTTIKEIELNFYSTFSSVRDNRKKVWVYLINAVYNRLVYVNDTPFGKHQTDINKLMLSNPNLKDINLSYYFNMKPADHYSNLLKYALSSDKYLEEFIVCIKNNGIKSNFFRNISKSKKLAKINTLMLQTNFVSIIEYSYLFKIETIICNFKENLNPNLIMDSLLKLANNPLNTVKRIIFENNEKKNCMQILSKFLNSSNEYNIPNFPKIYVDGYKEVIINNIRNKKVVSCLYQNSNSKYRSNIQLLSKDNKLNEYSFTQFLYILFNFPCDLGEIFTNYFDNANKGDTANPKCTIENIQCSINRMIELFIKFKEDNIPTISKKITSLIFIYNQDNPELNIFFYVILELLVEWKINRLILFDWSINDLANFMNKHKNLASLNIDYIFIQKKTSILDIKDINKLYQYSHLIKYNIYLSLPEEIDMKSENVLLELITIFDSQFKTNHNFIKLKTNFKLPSDSTNIYKFVNEQSITDYVNKMRNIRKSLYENNFFFQNINKFEIDIYENIDTQVVSNLLSFMKEYQYVLNEDSFKYLKHYSYQRKKSMRKTLYSYLEVNLDIRYRTNYTFKPSSKYIQYNKNTRRYLKLHNLIKNLKYTGYGKDYEFYYN